MKRQPQSSACPSNMKFLQANASFRITSETGKLSFTIITFHFPAAAADLFCSTCSVTASLWLNEVKTLLYFINSSRPFKLFHFSYCKCPELLLGKAAYKLHKQINTHALRSALILV